MAGKVKIMLIVTGARSQYVMLRDGDAPIVERTSEDYRGDVNVPPSIHRDEDLGLFVR
jgi:hypothetical protein